MKMREIKNNKNRFYQTLFIESFWRETTSYIDLGSRISPLSKRVEIWDQRRRARARLVMGSFEGARSWKQMLVRPNDPIIERAPSLAPGFRSFWKFNNKPAKSAGSCVDLDQLIL